MKLSSFMLSASSFLLLFFSPLRAPALDREEVQSELSGRTTVRTVSNRRFSGTMKLLSPGKISLATTVDDGEVIYTFRKSEIAGLDFAGESILLAAGEMADEDRFEEALPILEALYRQRVPYFDFMPEEDVRFFLRLVRAYEEANRSIEVIAVAKRLLPFLETPAAEGVLEDAVLLANYRLRLVKEAAELSRRWIKKHPPFHESALGWWVQARIAYEEEDFETAFWKGLQPIVFSGHLRMDFLDGCYALAITSAIKLKKEGKALLLYREMESRGLKWPKGSGPIPFPPSVPSPIP